MSSFVETKALELLTKSPVEFVEYPEWLKKKKNDWDAGGQKSIFLP